MLISSCSIALLMLLVKSSMSEFAIENFPNGSYSINGPPKEDESGQEGWTKMASGFVHTVQKDSAIDILLSLINQKNPDYVEVAKKVLEAEVGFVVCLSFGLLFSISMLIGCLSFTSCRCCCNKCGAKRTQTIKEDAKCRSNTYATLLFVSITFISIGCVCALLVNEEIKGTMKNINQIAVDMTSDIKEFVDVSYQQIHFLGMEGVDATIAKQTGRLDGFGEIVGKDIKAYAKILLADLRAQETLHAVINDTKSGIIRMSGVLDELDELKKKSKELVDELRMFRDSCSKSECKDLKPEQLVIIKSFDRKKIDDTLKELQKISIRKELEEAEENIEKIPTQIQEDGKIFIKDMKKRFVNPTADSPFFNETKSELEAMISSLEDATKQVKDYKDRIENIEINRYWGFIGSTLLILFPTGLMFLGLCCGLAGKNKSHYRQPANRSSISNCTGKTLIIAVYILFTFSWLVMIQTTVLFQIGAHLEIYVCDTIQSKDSSNLDKIAETVLDKLEVRDTKHYNVSNLMPSKMIKGCRNGSTLITVLNMEDSLKIKEFFNFQENFDVDREISKIPISDFGLGIKDIPKKLENNFNGVDLKSFRDDLDKFDETDVLALEAATILGNMKTISAIVNEAQLKDIIAKTEKLFFPEIAKFKTEQEPIVKEVITDLEEDEINIKTAVMRVKQFLGTERNLAFVAKTKMEAFALGLIDTGTDYAKIVQNKVMTDVTQCKILADIYDTATHIGCQELLAKMNGYWFGIGWSLFFVLFAIPFATKLSRHYLRMKPDLKDNLKYRAEYDDHYDRASDIPSSGSVQPGSTIALTIIGSPSPNQQRGYYDNQNYNSNNQGYNNSNGWNSYDNQSRYYSNQGPIQGYQDNRQYRKR